VLLCDACASAAGGAPGSGGAAPGAHGSAGERDGACDADCREWAPPAQLGCCTVRGAQSCRAPGGQAPAGSFDLVYLVAGVEGLDEYADAMGAWAHTVGAPPVRTAAVWRAQRPDRCGLACAAGAMPRAAVAAAGGQSRGLMVSWHAQVRAGGVAAGSHYFSRHPVAADLYAAAEQVRPEILRRARGRVHARSRGRVLLSLGGGGGLG
jgi:hypothetical protein